MKVNAIAQMLDNLSIYDTKIIVTVCDENGIKTEMELLSPDDLINGAVDAGCNIQMFFSNGKIFSGKFDSVEDEDGQLVVYVGNAKSGLFYGFPFDKLVGYYLV